MSLACFSICVRSALVPVELPQYFNWLPFFIIEPLSKPLIKIIIRLMINAIYFKKLFGKAHINVLTVNLCLEGCLVPNYFFQFRCKLNKVFVEIYSGWNVLPWMPFKIQRTLELSSNQCYNLRQNLLRNNPVPLNHENYTRWFLEQKLFE